MDNDEKLDTFIQFKVSSKVKAEFFRLMNQKCMSPSAYLRKMLADYIEESKYRDFY